jgi:hypothetical protein
MSDKIGVGAGLFQTLSGPFSDRVGGVGALNTKGGKYLIYALAIGVIVAVVVVLADTVYPFLPINPVSGPSADARAGKTFWKSTEGTTENLIVPATASPTVQADVYSISVQLIIGDARAPSLGKFRHILHRGSNPCQLTVSQPGSSGHAGIRPSDLPPGTEQTYTDLGLPAIMNPGLFLDKYKNDLHVFVHTKGHENGKEVLWLESMTVEDLPLNTPMTLGVVCNGKAIEVYVNCRLYSTLLLKGRPYLPKAENQWYGRYCAFPFTGLVKNLQLWPTALGSSDYMIMCGRTPPSFDMADVPTSASCS